MKKIISAMAAAVFAVAASAAVSAAAPGSIEDWGCDITSFFDESNTDTLLKVVYENSASDPTGWNIGFKINQTDWEESNAIYPFYQSPNESTVTFTITRDQIISDAQAKFGGELGDILWVDVRPGGDASIVSVEYLPENEPAEPPAEEPVEEPVEEPANEPANEPADDTADNPAAETTNPEQSKDSPDTGVEGITAVAGLAVLSGIVAAVTRKRS